MVAVLSAAMTTAVFLAVVAVMVAAEAKGNNKTRGTEARQHGQGWR